MTRSKTRVHTGRAAARARCRNRAAAGIVAASLLTACSTYEPVYDAAQAPARPGAAPPGGPCAMVRAGDEVRLTLSDGSSAAITIADVTRDGRIVGRQETIACSDVLVIERREDRTDKAMLAVGGAALAGLILYTMNNIVVMPAPL
jgi:hypothetical protein